MYDIKICAYQSSQPKNGIKGSSSLKTKGCNGVEVLNPKTLVYQHIKADFKRRFLVKMDFGAADFHPTPQPNEWHQGIANKMLEMLDLSGYFKI